MRFKSHIYKKKIKVVNLQWKKHKIHKKGTNSQEKNGIFSEIKVEDLHEESLKFIRKTSKKISFFGTAVFCKLGAAQNVDFYHFILSTLFKQTQASVY